MKKHKIKIEIEIDSNMLNNMLACALEGGINYWCYSALPVNNDYKGVEFASQVLTKGGALELVTDEGEKFLLTRGK